jgi:hypothetical protein
MDPTACFRAMCTTTDDDERKELGAALLDWLQRGGFPPDGESVADARGMAYAAITGR